MSEGKKVYRLEPTAKEATSAPKGMQTEQAFTPLEVAEQNPESAWDMPSQSDLEKNERSWFKPLLILFLVLFTVCVGWSLSQLLGEKNQAEAPQKREQEGLPLERQYLLRQKAVMQYFQAQNLEQRAKVVRQPERVKPLMTAHYQKFPFKSARSVVVRGEAPQIVNGKTIWKMLVDVDHKRRAVLVETGGDGKSVVDWEVDAGYQPTDLETFRAAKSTEFQPFRVHIRGAQKNGFHGFEFADYNQYRCFMVEFPNGDDYLWAYTEVNSELDKKWHSLVTEGGRREFSKSKSVPVMLELKFPENAQSKRCVYLGDLIAAGWVQPE